MRGRLLLAGIRAKGTPIGEYVDAEWAAMVELIGPVDNRHEVMAQLWADITGDEDAVAAAKAVANRDPERRGDQETVDAVRNLDDDALRRMVPAYARAMAEAEETGDDSKLAELDVFWDHTAAFAGGQQGLVDFAGDASKAVPKTQRTGGGTAAQFAQPAAPSFGMPEGL